MPIYSQEPPDRERHQRQFEAFYTRFARLYALFVSAVPLWRSWIETSLPHLVGARLLEVSFGTGHLMERYAADFDVYGIDRNARMVALAAERLRRRHLQVKLQVADVVRLPYASGAFDTVLCTMAFSGFADGRGALGELRRVLRPGGRLVLVDVNFPGDGNWRGRLLTQFWQAVGDVIRDVPALFREMGWRCRDEEVGGFGSVHLYLAEK